MLNRLPKNLLLKKSRHKSQSWSKKLKSKLKLTLRRAL